MKQKIENKKMKKSKEKCEEMKQKIEKKKNKKK
jgi:hypothetical protein